MVRISLKFVSIFVIILFLMLVSFFVDLLVRDRIKRLKGFSRITSISSRVGLRVLGVKVKVKNHELYRGDSNYLIVSNHLSYVDIFIISSLIPSVFIANSELLKEFPLGTITRYGGGVFIERRSRSKLSKEIEMISDILKSGLNVVLFPEGTTSNGERLLPFKTPFLTTAIKSGVDILLICLKYRRIDDRDIDIENRDSVFYYGSMSFFNHFFRLLSLRSVDVELILIEKIEPKLGLSRKELANLAYNTISLVYQ